ncbi:winged helix-turn-helix domain-containing protein [Polymorphospora rubra]|uniref:winged helix-turn-helix domain-containing protein n=1 Tax=Polymorphospora rubra TaxID=338584 RepID=UPI001BB3104D|nr:winged helix-turn-helix domain-containing protein [Polymorphospora rubra]
MSLEEDRLVLDGRSLRGIAHPLRVRILSALREDGPATATRLAELLGESTGSTSYHLRQLATYGFVVEDTERGVGRERWWRAAHRFTSFDGEANRDMPEESAAYLRAVAALYAGRVERWLDESADRTGPWRDTGTISDWRLQLTAEETRALGEELTAVLDRYREARPDAPASDGTERVVVQVQLMPFLRTEGGAEA